MGGDFPVVADFAKHRQAERAAGNGLAVDGFLNSEKIADHQDVVGCGDDDIA
jgi:hypothetical protein